MAKKYDVLIIGSGPAGLTAAIYAVRAGRSVIVIGGKEPGGQLMLTTIVEDYPGFPKGIQGPELMDLFRKQAERLGATIINENVTNVNFKKKPFTIETETKNKFTAKTAIIAVGSAYKWLGIPSETKLRGKGVTACAVCDGPLFAKKDVIVVGGGDAAMREAAFLANICKTVYIVHRRDKLRAQAALQETIKKKKNIKLVWNTEVDEFLGEKMLEAVNLKNIKTNKISTLKIQGAFIAIGHTPATGFLKGQVELDKKGYIVIKNGTETSVSGVFAAGDVKDYRYQQAVTAAGMGCMAAMDADHFMEGFRSISEKYKSKI